ncbi:MBOAT family O-acyltransferase [Paenibacillus albus]|uniref:MBOAT family protein n=1 Tax=Paenibacillus albus TaxID=2495582 RepID=A0A3Q8X9L0_9BACL|nr:MBOAT family O-acyltransferase [Paenibacillus albus]AZN43297.1 MBOAT family protein [Paenibacillus albus]
MIFSSVEYLVFFVVVILFMLVVKSAPLKKGFLIAASYYFYAYWDYRFVVLMFLLSFVNYHIGLRIEASMANVDRKRLLIASVVFNLCVLGVFKYFNFFTDSANVLLEQVGVRIPMLDIILPVGISFITFEVMSYTIDIYRRTNNSAKSFWDLALLVAFFPHLIAGPILKPSHFLPQIASPIVIRWKNVEQGMQIFLFGLVKKTLIADRIALFVDPVFAAPNDYSTLTVWLAVIAYAIQIYCDFSGYSDMAIGSAKILGFDIPRNFDMPYISRSITEFWRRWHISLSTWLREYLYFSLGGNRKGKARTYLNLLLVMLLGGLWHGASWNFVVWGGMHGLALAIHKFYMDYVLRKKKITNAVYQFFSWALTFLFVCVLWVFFRSSDFSVSMAMVRRMFIFSPGIDWIATSLLIIIPILLTAHFIGMRIKNYLYIPLNTFRGQTVFFFILFGVLFLMPVSSSPFIYFQF